MGKERHTKCSIEGCEGKGILSIKGTEVFSKGYCSMHYLRHIRHGDVNKIGRKVGEDRDKNPTYRSFNGIKGRCYNVNNQSYPSYGGRGIKVCDRWLGVHGFTNFNEDMGERPEGYSLDRINNDGDYEPSNCRWATAHTQAGNTRRSNKNVGVSYRKDRGTWDSRIKANGTLHTKSFPTESEAIAYRKELEQLYL
jgi:hypothetical protein